MEQQRSEIITPASAPAPVVQPLLTPGKTAVEPAPIAAPVSQVVEEVPPAPTAQCGAAQGVGTPIPPSSNLCASGTPTTVLGSGPWMWSCEMRGAVAANCIAPFFVNGMCGSSAENPQVSIPVSDLCRFGSPSAIMGTGPWDWNCNGAGGGTNASCHASLIEAASAPAPQPGLPPAPVADVPVVTQKAGNECSPEVRRWTITCQQGGYPTNYAGVIVGETQKLCPTGVERGVWLSNSCVATTNSAPVSPEPGVLVNPPPANAIAVADVLPDVSPLPVKKVMRPAGKKLKTPHFNGGDDASDGPAGKSASPVINEPVVRTRINFAPNDDSLDGNAMGALNELVGEVGANEKAIISLDAYAALPSGGDQQQAQRLSLARALAVRSYLMSRGINNNRIDVRALGPSSDARGADRVDIKVGG
jgi:outer membrane protein OmpA-like peptidoglycan-associated protein